MPTLTVKQVIQSELLRVCLEVTNRLREKQAKKKKPKYSPKEIARLRELTRSVGWDEATTDKWMEVHSILHDAPELKETELPLEMFCVFVCEQNVNGHRYTPNVPYICTQAKTNDNRGLDLEGVTNTHFAIKDQPRYATEEEVQFCIRNLNEKQMRHIHVSDIFKPIMESAMNKAVTVEEPKDNGELEDNGEIVLKDGRTITLAGAPDSD
jgi:hypothetical protein